MILSLLVDPAAHGKKSATLRWIASLGAPGVFAVALVDATIIPLAIPGSTDLLLLWLISNGGNPWLLVGCGVGGSLMGGWTTWRLGKKGGEAAIERYVSKRMRKRVQGWSEKHPLLMVFLPAILPPPIPLWPFLLAAGALGASGKKFAAAFGGGRLLRYGVVGWLAVRYGRHMVQLWAATLDKWGTLILCVFIGLTVLGLAWSLWKLRHQKAEKASETAAHAAD